MAFDFAAAPDLEPARMILAGKAPAADKRRAVLAAFDALNDCPDATATDWRSVAHMLSALLPKPKADAQPDLAAASGLEWCSYTAAQAKGNASSFYGQRWASFRFADGQTVTVSMRHKKSLDLPDWHRAARCAVAFYKAARARNFLQLVGGRYGNAAPSLEEIYANGCAVPPIVAAHDLTRDTDADLALCNAATESDREGPRYLSELVSAACAFDGDWQSAWQGEKCRLLTALARDRKSRATVADLLAAA